MEIIYKHTNKINGKAYIGKTSLSMEERLKQHLDETKDTNNNRLFVKALKKYGVENFESEILENDCIDTNEREKFFIKKYKTHFVNGYGYNMTDGGDGGDVISNHPNREEIVKKMSESKKGEKILFLVKHILMKIKINLLKMQKNFILEEKEVRKLN